MSELNLKEKTKRREEKWYTIITNNYGIRAFALFFILFRFDALYFNSEKKSYRMSRGSCTCSYWNKSHTHMHQLCQTSERKHRNRHQIIIPLQMEIHKHTIIHQFVIYQSNEIMSDKISLGYYLLKRFYHFIFAFCDQQQDKMII